MVGADLRGDDRTIRIRGKVDGRKGVMAQDTDLMEIQ